MPIALCAVALTLLGCGTAARSLRSGELATGFTRDVMGETREDEPSPPISPLPILRLTFFDEVVPADPLAAPGVLLLAQAADPDAEDFEPYDPWEGFNEKMFELNLRLDRWIFKPVATVYRFIMPEPFQVMIANGFDNIRVVPRLVNSMLQGKFGGAGRELARFLINSTAGIGGLFDPAKDYWGIPSSREDFGQTLGVWGAGPGPYLVLPFMEPMTVRDGIGRGVDMFLDPLSYVLPLFWERIGMKAGEMINERALYFDLFQGVEETTLDLYSSVRHFYLLRRERQIKE
jgi:phospholipid-binding lipoprotein MlaA